MQDQLLVTNMLRFSATVAIFQFLTYSGSGNVAYIMMLGYHSQLARRREKYEETTSYNNCISNFVFNLYTRKYAN